MVLITCNPWTNQTVYIVPIRLHARLVIPFDVCSNQNQPNQTKPILERAKVLSSMRWQIVTATNPLNVMNHILFLGHCEHWTVNTHSSTFIVHLFEVTWRTICNHSYESNNGSSNTQTEQKQQQQQRQTHKKLIRQSKVLAFVQHKIAHAANSHSKSRERKKKKDASKKKGAQTSTRKITRIKLSYGCFVVPTVKNRFELRMSFILAYFSLDLIV